MKFAKVVAGSLVAVGVPAVFGVLLAVAGLSFADQHVVDITYATVNGQAVASVHEFDHSTAGIAATAAMCGLAWLLVTFLAILAGVKMIVNRNKDWHID